MKVFGNKVLKMVKDIKYNLCFSIWVISKWVFKQESVKLKLNKLYIKGKSEIVSKLVRDMKY